MARYQWQHKGASEILAAQFGFFGGDWFRLILPMEAAVGGLAITQPLRIARSLLSFVSLSVKPGKPESALY